MKLDYDKCKHCKYFYQHYGIDFNCVHKIYCGHCIKQPDSNNFRVYSGKQPCPYFEQNKGQHTKIKKRKIIDLLEELNLNIEYIKSISNISSIWITKHR